MLWLQFLNIFYIVCLNFKFKKSFHSVLSVINKKSSNKNPDNIAYESSKTKLLNIFRFNCNWINKVTESNSKNNLSTLTHHFLKRKLECLMKSKSRPAADFSVILWINSKALCPYLDEDYWNQYETLSSQPSHWITVLWGWRTRLWFWAFIILHGFVCHAMRNCRLRF